MIEKPKFKVGDDVLVVAITNDNGEPYDVNSSSTSIVKEQFTLMKNKTPTKIADARMSVYGETFIYRIKIPSGEIACIECELKKINTSWKKRLENDI